MKHIYIWLIVLVLLGLGSYALRQSVGANRQVSTGLVFDHTEFDFGVVKQSTGKVPHDFPFVYQGDQAIDIVDLPTSCGCTTATATPTHLNKGDRGIITVTFNPNHHAEPPDKFFRTVSVKTQPAVSTPELKVWADVDMDIGPQIFEMNTPDND